MIGPRVPSSTTPLLDGGTSAPCIFFGCSFFFLLLLAFSSCLCFFFPAHPACNLVGIRDLLMKGGVLE